MTQFESADLSPLTQPLAQPSKLCVARIGGRQRKTKIGSEKLFEVTDHIIKEHIRKGTIKE